MISREDLFKYTEFLLPAHNCVVIPNLGGFIVNMEASLNEDGCLMPPICRIAFNPDLQYDDGLLTSELAKNNSDLTYASISKILKQLTTSIRQSLKEGNSIECGRLGALVMQEGNICFLESSRRVFPAYFGLSKVNLPLLSLVDKTQEQKSNRVYLIGLKTVASVAAAIVIFFLFVIPSSHFENNKMQRADLNLISDAVQLIKESHDPVRPSTAVSHQSVGVKHSSSSISSASNKAQLTSAYYLVVASCDTKYQAEKTKTSLRYKGFSSVNVLKVRNHYRIYVAKYLDNHIAMNRLSYFKKNHPAYSTAWILHN